VQQAVEAPNFTSYQMQSSFGAHVSEPGRLQVTPKLTAWVVGELSRMGYKVESENRPYSPITAIYFDPGYHHPAPKKRSMASHL